MNRIFTSATLLGIAALFLAGCANQQSAAVQDLAQPIWSDEFDAGSIDAANWNLLIGGDGWGNNELQYYTDRESNVRVENGELIIEAHQEQYGGHDYTSARLTTKGKREFKYGKIEARMKLPQGQGLWPAFWLLGANFDSVGWPACGEIDVMEHINNEDQIHGTIHWRHFLHRSYGGSVKVNPEDYNIYSITWNDRTIKWSVNGQEYLVADITGSAKDEFRQSFFIILNLAVGGNWPGSPDATTQLPARVYVDWVRVYAAAP